MTVYQRVPLESYGDDSSSFGMSLELGGGHFELLIDLIVCLMLNQWNFG